MLNEWGLARDSRDPGGGPGNRAGRQPAEEDIWQAASLLVGVYGRGAAAYAGERKARLDGHGDREGAMVWDLILSRVETLLRGAPARSVN